MNKVQVLSNARCGSSYLFHALSAYHSPDMLNKFMFDDIPVLRNRRLFSETFLIDADNNLPEEEFIRRNLELIRQHEKYVIKTHVHEINTLKKYNLLDEFKMIDHYRIVLLRKNIFESSLSSAVASIKNEWTMHKNMDTITVPEQDFRDVFNFQFHAMTALVDNTYELVYNEVISYEDLSFWPRKDFYNTKLCNDNIDALKKVQIRDRLYKSPDKKQTVSNYDELYEYCLELISQKSCDFGKFEGTMLTEVNVKMNDK